MLRISVLIRLALKSMKVLMVGKKTENKAVGRTRGGLNTKIHAIVDALGNPAAFLLSPGNDNDSSHAIELMGLRVNPKFCVNSIWGANRAKFI